MCDKQLLEKHASYLNIFQWKCDWTQYETVWDKNFKVKWFTYLHHIRSCWLPVLWTAWIMCIKGSLDWQIDQHIGQNVVCQSVNTGPASHQCYNRYLVDAAANIVGSTPALRWWFTDTLQGISDDTLINISNNILVGWHCFNALPYWRNINSCCWLPHLIYRLMCQS